MKNIAVKEKPTSSGWYVWWDMNPPTDSPYHVLAKVKLFNGTVMVNFESDVDFNDFVPIQGVADRLWLKVS